MLNYENLPVSGILLLMHKIRYLIMLILNLLSEFVGFKIVRFLTFPLLGT